ncbi:hypothetical protein [Thiocapsa sp. UBA6158]|uniref:hypothetical protein n=1 Tax=Thiocapsa sp. UBA6158 TaxID=1947692 RepID=UPI0025FE4673|nr:hypothetical protein [Thiocapsa sp. UBA6158]
MSTPSLLHIFRAGTYQAMAGQSITLTPADLAATAAAYDPARHEAPLVVGHPVGNGPAWGWVSGLSADGADLSATPRDVAAEFAEAVRARRYAKVSASFWPPTHPANPAPGVWSLRHVGFLGAAVPAVLGLAPVSLADDAEGLVTIEADPLDFSSPADTPATDPEPTMPDPAAASAADPTADFAAREAALTALQTDLTAREAAIAEREAAAAAQAEALRRTEIASFVGALVAEGRLLPIEQAPLVALLATAPAEPAADFAAPADTGEPTPRAAAEWLRAWLQTLPVRVSYGEFAAPDGHDPEVARIEAAARTMAGLPPLESK